MQERQRRFSSLGKVLTYAALIFAAFYSFWPILIMGLEGYGADLAPLISGKGVRQIGNVIVIGGFHPTPIHYIDALTFVAFPRLLANTATIAAISIVVALAAGVTAGYTLARLPIRGKGVSPTCSWRSGRSLPSR